MISKEELKERAKVPGIDLLGFASLERFDGLPPERHPASIFPETKTVIVLAKKVLRGSLRGIEEGTYWSQGEEPLIYRLLYLTYNLGRILEDDGWEAVPVCPVPPDRYPQGIAVSEDRPAPNIDLSLKYAAVAAGLGEIGYCDIFLTPEFGPLQELGVILTDAVFEPDPPFEGKICDAENCLACVKACPFGAIGQERETIIMSGKKMEYAKVNFKVCNNCPNGAFPWEGESKEHEPNRSAASCVRACLSHLEKEGKLKVKFHSSFRKREPWSLSMFDV